MKSLNKLLYSYLSTQTNGPSKLSSESNYIPVHRNFIYQENIHRECRLLFSRRENGDGRSREKSKVKIPGLLLPFTRDNLSPRAAEERRLVVRRCRYNARRDTSRIAALRGG